MTWAGVLRWVAPYAILFLIGFGAAWKAQGVRLEAARNDLAGYKLEQQRLKNEAEIAAEKRRRETADEWHAKLGVLEADHETYRRCVAAGRCGARVVRLCGVSDGAGRSVSAPGGVDGDGANTVSAAGGVAAEDGILKDCARTTLQLNQLQADIDKQRGR